MAAFYRCDGCGCTVNTDDYSKLNQVRMETWRAREPQIETVFRAEFCDTCYCNLMYEMNRMRGR